MDRYTQALTVPFQSLRMGRSDSPDESAAVANLQKNLNLLTTFWYLLPEDLQSSPGGVPNPEMIMKGVFGPYYLGDEAEEGAAYFGPLTEQAVRDFQEEVRIEVDGKAGMNTLRELSFRVKIINLEMAYRGGRL